MALQPSLLPRDDTIVHLPHHPSPLISNSSGFPPISGLFSSTNIITPPYLPMQFLCCPFHQNVLAPESGMPEQIPASWASIGRPIQQLPGRAMALFYDYDLGWSTSVFEAPFQPDSLHSAQVWALPTNNDCHLAIHAPISTLDGQHWDNTTNLDTQYIRVTDDITKIDLYSLVMRSPDVGIMDAMAASLPPGGILGDTKNADARLGVLGMWEKVQEDQQGR
ncbi:hypothetical protein HD806DRAFT_532240 [Xylariaceae sp. AK1471]|nr:hypothetical protein HD806DRAFT_532240 [Xylariaceae sp. AK1471]